MRTGNEDAVPLSAAGLEIRRYVSQPLTARRPVGYNREFLDSYRPNMAVAAYLSPAEREHLAAVGQPNFEGQPADTYARQILNRLLIDLSWNSSRLESNTYSLLDTNASSSLDKRLKGGTASKPR